MLGQAGDDMDRSKTKPEQDSEFDNHQQQCCAYQ
jgi:hypothetical protein